MASVKAILYKSKKKSDGRYPIAIRIIVNRKPKYTYIDWIYEKDWNKLLGKVKSSHPNSKRLNNLIQKKLIEADDMILEAESLKRNYTSGEIKDAIKNNSGRMSFFKMANKHVSSLSAIGKHNRASSEQGMLNNISTMLNKSDILFHQIDENFLNRLKVYLMGSKGISERSVINHYVFIRTIFNKAISNNIVDSKYYPFGKGKVKIKYPESVKIGLDKNEILSLEKLNLEKYTLLHSRNVFLFSFYLAGIRVSDVLRMQWNDIIDGRLVYSMGKNKKSVSLQVPEKALKIIEFYRNDKKSDTDYIFPELKKADANNDKDIHAKIRTATKKFNKYLSKLAAKAEIKKKVTMHIARHSFGNIAGDNISPQMLQKLYRHSNITTTMGYQGNFIHKDADDALGSVINF